MAQSVNDKQHVYVYCVIIQDGVKLLHFINGTRFFKMSLAQNFIIVQMFMRKHCFYKSYNKH